MGDTTSPNWTIEHTELLRKMWAEGATSGEIAAALGVTRNAVIGRTRRLGLLNMRRKPETKSPVEERPPPRRKPAPEQRPHLGGRKGKSSGADAPKMSNPPTLPPERIEIIPEAQRCTILDLSWGRCRWPVGDPRNKDDFFFCGGITEDGENYCRYPAAIARPRGSR